MIGGVVLFVAFLAYESRISDPMLKLDLFKSRNFSVGNIETLALYGGLSALFFFLTVYLQQVAGYSPLKSGLALLPESLVMFAFSSRFGALADRFGPRWFMGGGPLIAGGGMLMLLTDRSSRAVRDRDPSGILLFSLGLSITVAPLTAAILAGVSQDEAGIGSAINNAVARVAGLIATVAIGALVAAQFSSSLDRHLAGQPLTPRGRCGRCRGQAAHARPAVGRRRSAAPGEGDRGRLGPRLGRRVPRRYRSGRRARDPGRCDRSRRHPQPRRAVQAEQCSGGQLAGAPLDAAGVHAPTPA